MILNFQPYKEKRDEDGTPIAYLLQSPNDKQLFCEVNIIEDCPELKVDRTHGKIASLLRSKVSELAELDWENLSSTKKQIEKYLIDNFSTDDISFIENNFYVPEENDKTYLLEFVNEE